MRCLQIHKPQTIKSKPVTIRVRKGEDAKAFSDNNIVVKKLGLGYATKDGPYWVEVMGNKIGERDRTHWSTARAAWLAGYRHFMRVRNAT
jgi:hypothetical protein